MNQQEIKERLAAQFGEQDLNISEFRGEITVTVPKDKILQVCDFMKNSPDLDFDFLSFVAGVDLYPDAPGLRWCTNCSH